MKQILINGTFILTLLSCDNEISYCNKNYLNIVDYATPSKCWMNENKEFESFVILTKSTNGYFPTFISKKCSINEYINIPILSINKYRNIVYMESSNILKTEENTRVFGNSLDHLPPITESDEVYFLRAYADVAADGEVLNLKILKVSGFASIGMTLGHFLKKRSKC